MTKIYLELNLKEYSKTELIEMMRLCVLTHEEVKAELLSRGMTEWAVVTMMRAA